MKPARLLSLLDRLLTVTVAVIIIIMMLHVTTHALMRYFFGAPLPATNELIEFVYVPVVALTGLPAALMQKEQITATLVTDRMTLLNALIFRAFGCLLAAILSGLWSYFGFQEAIDRMQVGATAGFTNVTVWPVYFVVPVVFALLCALYIYNGIRIAKTGQTEPQLVPEMEEPVAS